MKNIVLVIIKSIVSRSSIVLRAPCDAHVGRIGLSVLGLFDVITFDLYQELLLRFVVEETLASFIGVAIESCFHGELPSFRCPKEDLKFAGVAQTN